MTQPKRPVVFMLIVSALILIAFLIMQPLLIETYREKIDMLFPGGSIAIEQRNLLFILQALMLLVILPVFILTFVFSWKYRSNNPKAVYDPHLIDNVYAEFIWWGLPLVMTIIASILTWYMTHKLDPFKPIVSDKKAITIQVVALQWKWLFIYPEENVASVNLVQFPEKTPIHFEITADAPMNSFWIPSLGGQIYAMPKMKTELYLIADQAGDFRGSSANLSGEGFSGMTFTARASSDEDFKKWVDEAKGSSDLNMDSYNKLAEPSQNDPVKLYRLQEGKLFDRIMMKFMHPQEKQE